MHQITNDKKVKIIRNKKWHIWWSVWWWW